MSLLIKSGLLQKIANFPVVFSLEKIHTTVSVAAWQTNNKPQNWLRLNKKIYPPQSPDEEPRQAVSF